MRPRLTAIILAVAILLLSAGTGLAAGNGAFTTTTVTKDVVFTARSTDSCHNDAPVTFESIEHNVFHVTERADGAINVHGLQSGTFTFTPDDPSIPTTSGHFTARFSFNGTRGQATFASTQTLTGQVGNDPSARRVFHETVHFIITPTGDVKVEFGSIQVHCP
jgi:hypothetical protein